jgi:hypothetical protein
VRGASGRCAYQWEEFGARNGTLGGQLGAHAVGAAAVRLAVPPGANASLTISLGWFFPQRDFMGATVGNHYSTLVRDSEAASQLLLGGEAAAADIRGWGAVASALLESSLPAWFGDSLLNSLHHTRSAMWLEDGRWRQWESFSCVNVDSVHVRPHVHDWPAPSTCPCPSLSFPDLTVRHGLFLHTFAERRGAPYPLPHAARPGRDQEQDASVGGRRH